jgi:hypothetical protein
MISDGQESVCSLVNILLFTFEQPPALTHIGDLLLSKLSGAEGSALFGKALARSRGTMTEWIMNSLAASAAVLPPLAIGGGLEGMPGQSKIFLIASIGLLPPQSTLNEKSEQE